jgi:hypothetical protein
MAEEAKTFGYPFPYLFDEVILFLLLLFPYIEHFYYIIFRLDITRDGVKHCSY